MLDKALSRGELLPGGACAAMGICGASFGVGGAFGILLQANPLNPRRRRVVLEVTAKVLAEIASREAACRCRRECVIALRIAAKLSIDHLPVPLRAEADWQCTQMDRNSEFLGETCPTRSW